MDEPIDEQLLANLEEEIDVCDNTIDFGFYGGERVKTSKTDPASNIHNPAEEIKVLYEGFDRSMKEEYKALNTITRSVLSKYGRITNFS